MQAAIRAVPYFMQSNIRSSVGGPSQSELNAEYQKALETAPFGLGKTFARSGKKESRMLVAEPSDQKTEERSENRKTAEARKAAPAPSIFEALRMAFAPQHFYDAYAQLALALAAIHLVTATWWNSLFIRYATRAKPLARKDFPELYNVVENLAISAGVPCPAIEVVDSPKLNAYASGLTPKSARLGLTTGLIEKLSRDELEAVVAHELTHIRQGDSRLMAVLKACVDLVLPRTGQFAENVRAKPFSSAFLVILMMSFLGYKFLLLIGAIVGVLTLATYAAKAMVLHAREYVADAGAIELTKNPAALISALCKISADDHLPVSNAATQAMMFSGSAGGIFSTHPSVEDRIAAIQEHGGVGAADVTAERARGVRSVAPPMRDARSPVFGRRRVHGMSGLGAADLVAARTHATQAEPRAIWAEQSVFTGGAGASTVDHAPTGDSLFERWILTGRLERITTVIKKIAFAPFKLLFAFQMAIGLFALVMMLLMSALIGR